MVSRTIVIIVCIAAMFSSAAIAQSIDVMAIVGKTQDQVAEILGPPTAPCTSVNVSAPGGSGTKPDVKCLYKNEAVDVIFVDRKADWITVFDVMGRFAPGTLSEVGLKARRETFKNPIMYRWRNIPGLAQVQMFKGQADRVHYILVIAKTL